MQLALGDLDYKAVADSPVAPVDGSGTHAPNLPAVADVEAALNRASERITRAIAEGFALDPGAKPQHGDHDNSTDSPIDLVRPLLQSLLQRGENLQTILKSFAEIDPVGHHTERFIALLEEAIDEVEHTLADGNKTAAQVVLPQPDPRPAVPPATPSLVSMVAGPDLDPASLFTPCATVNLRPATNPPPTPAAVAAPLLATPRRAKSRLAVLALFTLGLCFGPLSRIGPEVRHIAAPLADAPAADPRDSPELPTRRDDPEAAGRVVEPSTTQTTPGPAPAPRPADEPASGRAAPAAPEQPPQNDASTAKSTTGDPAIADLYTARGDEKLVQKDISAARKFYEFAAGAGSAKAALALARTYDPDFLAQYGVIGPAADKLRAAMWYRRAALLGAPTAIAEASSAAAKARASPVQPDGRKPAP